MAQNSDGCFLVLRPGANHREFFLESVPEDCTYYDANPNNRQQKSCQSCHENLLLKEHAVTARQTVTHESIIHYLLYFV